MIRGKENEKSTNRGEGVAIGAAIGRANREAATGVASREAAIGAAERREAWMERRAAKEGAG